MEVIPGIHDINTRMARSYLLVGEQLTLIDTGGSGSANTVMDYIKNVLKREPADIKTIIITHYHFDHVGSLYKLKNITGAKIAIHNEDNAYISGQKKQEGPAFLNIMVKLLQTLYRSKPVEGDILLDEGDVISGYKVIHTPGHTPGSICLYKPENKAIFAGDNLRYSKGVIKGPGARLIPEPEKYKKSMEKLADLDIEVILCGHSRPITSHASGLLKEYLKTL